MLKKSKQRGIALVYSLFVSAIVLILTILSLSVSVSSLKSANKQYTKLGMAKNIAEAGMQDAYFWFSRQSSAVKYPKGLTVSPLPQANDINIDVAFAPIEATSIDDPGDTDNASLGITRDVPIDTTTNIYGCYVVKKQSYDPDTDSGVYDPYAAHDVSHLRSNQSYASGAIWKLVSTGYIYKRNDKTTDSRGIFTTKYDEPPNEKKEEFSIGFQVQRVSLALPNPAAIILNKGAKVTTQNNNCQIVGDINYLIAAAGGSVPSLTSPLPFSGTPIPSSSLNLSVDSIFGITKVDLKGIAIQPVSTVSEIKTDPEKMVGSSTIIYMDNTTAQTFDSNNPLKGGGILYVKGDLTFAHEGGSYFYGIIYMEDGDLTVNAGNIISGAVINASPTSSAKGYVKLLSTSDKATVEYNEGVLNNLRRKLANYRINNNSFAILQDK